MLMTNNKYAINNNRGWDEETTIVIILSVGGGCGGHARFILPRTHSHSRNDTLINHCVSVPASRQAHHPWPETRTMTRTAGRSLIIPEL